MCAPELPELKDAEQLIDFLKAAAGETSFLLNKESTLG